MADGELPVMLSPDRQLPMVAPSDVGQEAARLLMLDEPHRGPVHVEGPSRCTLRDVADVFATVLGRSVRLLETSSADWRRTFLAAGLSASAAETFTGLTALVDRETWELETAPVRGSTPLRAYVSTLVARTGGTASDG